MTGDLRKLLIKLGLILPLFIIVAAVNLSVDPARLFKNKSYEEKIAQALLAGQNVTAFTDTNFDDRYQQKYLLDNLNTKFDIVVFGSSRTMQISSLMFPGKSLFNSSVSAGTLQDHVALYGLYREKGLIPKTVIIGIDDWIFNYNNRLNKWQNLKFQYEKTVGEMTQGSRLNLKLRINDLISTKYLEVFSLSYFQSSLQYLKANQWKPRVWQSEDLWFRVTSERYNDGQTIFPDGSRTWTKKDRLATPESAKGEIKETLDAMINGQGVTYIDLDADLKKQFEDFISLLQKDGVKVIFWLPPYHPEYYDTYLKINKQKIFEKVENYLRSLALAHDIPCIGSYNPYALSLDASHFSDYAHLRDDTEILRLFAEAGER